MEHNCGPPPAETNRGMDLIVPRLLKWHIVNSSDIKSIQRLPLLLQCIENVPGRNRHSTGMLRIDDDILEQIREEISQKEAGLVVDETGDALDAATTRKATDGRLGYDALDVSSEDFSVAFGSSFSETFASFAAV